MTLPPYYVLWGFCSAAVLLLTLGGLWLVAHETARRILSGLMVSDGIALWLGFGAVFHLVSTALPPGGQVMEARGGAWVAAAWAAALLSFRLIPGLRKRETLLLAAGVAGWAWSIGAGYQFIGEMAEDADLLREAPDRIFASPHPDLRPLRNALLLAELDDEQRKRTARLLVMLADPGSADQAQLSAARQLLVPELREYFRRDLSRLHTYQVLQLVLLGAVLLAWGFGRPPPQ